MTANSEGRVVKINKAVDPPGEARATGGSCRRSRAAWAAESIFSSTVPREIFDELRVASKGGNADYYGITYEKIERRTASSGRARPKIIRARRGCLKTSFYHPDGKAKFHAIEYKGRRRSA